MDTRIDEPGSTPAQVTAMLMRRVLIARKNKRYVTLGLVVPILYVFLASFILWISSAALGDVKKIKMDSWPLSGFTKIGKHTVLPYINKADGDISDFMRHVKHEYNTTLVEYTSEKKLTQDLLSKKVRADFGLIVSRADSALNTYTLTVMYNATTGSPTNFLSSVFQAIYTNEGIDIVLSATEHPFPYKPTINPEAVDGVVFAYLLAFTFAFPAIPSVIELVKEKEKGLKALMMMMSLRVWNYWLGNVIGDMLLLSIPLVSAWITFAIFGFPMFRENNFLVYAIPMTLYVVTMLVIAYAFSFIFDEEKTASRWLSSTLMLLILVPGLIQGFVAGKVSEKTGNLIATILAFLPPGNLSYVIRTCAAAAADKDALSFGDLFRPSRGLFYALLIQLNTLAILIGLVVLLDYLAREELSFSDFIRRRGRHEAGSPPPASRDPDEDVVAEAARVSSPDCDDMVIIQDLQKVYHGESGANWANKGVSFGVRPGECFGLLGPNGAGKTTALSVVTGLARPTRGSVTVCGNSVTSDLDAAYMCMGVCPQQDALFDDLTVDEHLRLYGLIRGLSRDVIAERKADIIAKMDLGEHVNKQSTTLSGGNKRKLSVGIALMANPRVLFLDEPTTGMDPGTRRALWDVVLAAVADGVSVILTTHSMEEADALCQRIAIVVNGRLRCIGSSQHLKHRFGSGYKLSLAAPLERADDIREWVTGAFDGAEFYESVSTLLTFQIPKESASLSRIFTVLEEGRDEYDIEDFSVCQTTLEQIFIDFASEQDEEVVEAEAVAGSDDGAVN